MVRVLSFLIRNQLLRSCNRRTFFSSFYIVAKETFPFFPSKFAVLHSPVLTSLQEARSSLFEQSQRVASNCPLRALIPLFAGLVPFCSRDDMISSLESYRSGIFSLSFSFFWKIKSLVIFCFLKLISDWIFVYFCLEFTFFYLPYSAENFANICNHMNCWGMCVARGLLMCRVAFLGLGNIRSDMKQKRIKK